MRRALLSMMALLILNLQSPARATPAPGTSASSRKLAATDCRRYRMFTWELDLKRGKLKRLGVSDEDTEICGPLALSGAENVRIELRAAGGRVLYERPIQVSLSQFFDALPAGRDPSLPTGPYEGGVVAAELTVVNTYFPSDLESPPNGSQLTLISIAGGRALVKGSP